MNARLDEWNSLRPSASNSGGQLFFLLGCTHPVESLPATSASGYQADTGVLCVHDETRRTPTTWGLEMHVCSHAGLRKRHVYQQNDCVKTCQYERISTRTLIERRKRLMCSRFLTFSDDWEEMLLLCREEWCEVLAPKKAVTPVRLSVLDFGTFQVTRQDQAVVTELHAELQHQCMSGQSTPGVRSDAWCAAHRNLFFYLVLTCLSPIYEKNKRCFSVTLIMQDKPSARRHEP